MKIKVHENARTVGEAFTGVDKMERIHDKLKELVRNDTSSKFSDVIQLAINLYADTTEEAVGIALEVKHLIQVRAHQLSKEEDREKLLDIFKGGYKRRSTPMDETADLLKELLKTRDPESPATLSLQAKILSDMGKQGCEECTLNGDCPTQEIADDMAPEWREGRDL